MKADEMSLVILIILIAVIAFGLGRLSISQKSNSVKIIQPTKSSTSTIPQNKILEKAIGNGAVIASKSGEAYHLPWCSGPSRIKPENIIWFKSSKEAEEAGYRPAKNCKGIR